MRLPRKQFADLSLLANATGVEKFVLFVEDDSIQARVLAAACKSLNIPTSTYAVVPSGVEAISYLERSRTLSSGSVARPDLIITDLKMPVIDGISLLKWIRGTPEFASMTVIILTAAFEPHMKKTARELDCDGFFEKPVGLVKIAETIKFALAVERKA